MVWLRPTPGSKNKLQRNLSEALSTDDRRFLMETHTYRMLEGRVYLFCHVN